MPFIIGGDAEAVKGELENERFPVSFPFQTGERTEGPRHSEAATDEKPLEKNHRAEAQSRRELQLDVPESYRFTSSAFWGGWSVVCYGKIVAACVDSAR